MGTLSKNITIFDPDLTEWVPMYFGLDPILASPIAVNVDLNSLRRVSGVMYLNSTSFINEHMDVSSFPLGRLRVF